MSLTRFQVLAFHLIIALSYCIIFLDEQLASSLVQEDGPIENATAVFFFIASVLFLGSYYTVRTHLNAAVFERGRQNSYLILAFLMLLCMGEEISWGQRIFNWETPATIAKINNQQETNLHNLAFLEGYKTDAGNQSYAPMLITPLRLFFLFSFVYFIGVPVLGRISGTAKAVLCRIGIPIAPLWLGTMFLTNYVVCKAAVIFIGESSNHNIHELDELKEMYYALIYTAAGFSTFYLERQAMVQSGV